MEDLISRRPLSSRDKTWSKKMASWLTHQGVKPNSISVMSAIFSTLSASFLIGLPQVTESVLPNGRSFFLSLIVVGLLGRLLCNLLDGMVAIEGGLKTKSGEIFNDFPDRLSDLVIFIALGFAAAEGSSNSFFWIQLGWATALAAILTAYVRYLGAGCGVGHFFSGPMAKQHRMAATIAATFSSFLFEPQFFEVGTSYRLALSVVFAGSLVTCANRVRKIVKKLELN